MMKVYTAVILFVSLLSLCQAKPIIPDEEWGYFSIDKVANSNMFWWLYGSTNTSRDSLPLVLWLQGGPGGSSMIGNFLEVGPLNQNLKPRQLNWLLSANVIFVDSPIGAGFSYGPTSSYSTTDAQVTANLITFLTQLTAKYSWAQTQPLWIFGESYGGKVASLLGVELDSAIAAGKIKMNFRGVGLGDAWIAPLECMASYGQFLESASLIDGQQADELNSLATQAQQKLNSGDGKGASALWSKQQDRISAMTSDVDLYDYLRYRTVPVDLTNIMNGQVRQKLGATIPASVKWVGVQPTIFTNLLGDFMKPATKAVETLLNKKYGVAVYTGQLDIIVDVVCVNNWVEKLQWSGAQSFFKAPRVIKNIDNSPAAAVKRVANLQLWNIYSASHQAPIEAPAATLAMLNSVISS